MRRNRIKITLLAVAVAMLTLITQNTVAYYTNVGTATNVVTSGDISAQIIEKMGDGDFPQEGVYVMPGSVISKKVSVVNTGGHPFWLRVKLTDAIDDKSLSSDIMELDLNLRDWIDGNDGFYYYKNPVQPGAETEKLFTQVKIAGNIDNTYLSKTLELTVSAYAVQSEHNGTSPLDAAGWPAEGGDGV